MTINKNVTLKYIHYGKYYNVKVLFKEYYLDKIPIYISDDIDDVLALQLDDLSVVVIINSSIVNKLSKEILEQIVIFNLLNIYYKYSCDKSIVDLCMASYYGYKATIDLLMMHSNIESNQKLKRVKFLENLITSNQILNVPEKYDIINSIKYVEIGDKNEEIS